MEIWGCVCGGGSQDLLFFLMHTCMVPHASREMLQCYVCMFVF